MSGFSRRFIEEVGAIERDINQAHPGLLGRGDLFTLGKTHAQATYHEVKRHRQDLELALIKGRAVAFATALDNWRNSILSMARITAKQMECAA
mgnify:CR=1 FL=1